MKLETCNRRKENTKHSSGAPCSDYINSAELSMNSRRLMLKATRGFTLVEMIVAIGLFSVVMIISTQALLTIIDASYKSQSLQSVMNNLNFAFDTMTRSMRVGTNYHCGLLGNFSNPQDCFNIPQNGIAFRSKDGTIVAYRFRETDTVNHTGQIERAVASFNEDDFIPITAPEVKVTKLNFFVQGTNPLDTVQPRVLIILQGFAVTNKEKVKSEFNLQTLVSQRFLDLQ